MSRDTRLDEASPEALLVEFEIAYSTHVAMHTPATEARYQAAASAIRKRLRAASLSVSPVPPDCKNCGYPRSEHHVGEGWCLQSPAAYPTKYAPALAEPDEPREIDLMKALVESLKNRSASDTPPAVSPVPEPSEPQRYSITDPTTGEELPCTADTLIAELRSQLRASRATK